MTAAENIASLEEIRDLLKVLPQADEEAAEIAQARQAHIPLSQSLAGGVYYLSVSAENRIIGASAFTFLR